MENNNKKDYAKNQKTDMNIRLSIIIPFYNVEQYIAQCLDSVYKQDIPENEYEVICVNDASPDGSREIVKEYQKKHKNLILVEHEVNKKLGSARNTGRRIAKGKYLWNVDSDDMIAPNCLKEMLDICDTNELDVFVFSFYRHKGGKLLPRGVEPWMDINSVYTGLTFWKHQGIRNQKEVAPVWTQLYRKSYLDAKNIYSPEINMGEDVPYSYASILLADRMMACNKPYYVYRVNEASLTGGINHAPKPEIVYENCFVCSKRMNDIIQRIPKSETDIVKTVKSTQQYIVWQYQQFASCMDIHGRKELARLVRRNFLRNMFVFGLMGWRRKIAYIVFSLSGKII